jgi:AraC family transcriptional regulator
MLGQVQRVHWPAMPVEVAGRADQVARHLAQALTTSEQPRAELRLEPADRLRHRRPRQAQFLGRAAEGAALRDLREDGEAFEVRQSGHECRSRKLGFLQCLFSSRCPVNKIQPEGDRAGRIGRSPRVLDPRYLENPVECATHDAMRYPRSALLGSLVPYDCSTIEAELRSHVAGETVLPPRQEVEICIVLEGNDDGLVKRSGAGQCDQAVPTAGSIWLSPICLDSKVLTITQPIASTLHLRLRQTLFDQLSDDFDLPTAAGQRLRAAAGVRDDVIYRVGRSIVEVVKQETTAGRMYVETVSTMLAARLLQKYIDAGTPVSAAATQQAFDRARLRRVLDYIESSIQDDMSLDSLAAVAGYSTFHFARKFAQAMGLPPHRYVSRIRLEKAKAELVQGKLPLAEIALNARFSSQASFTRAFRRATGTTPKQYQRRRR